MDGLWFNHLPLKNPFNNWKKRVGNRFWNPPRKRQFLVRWGTNSCICFIFKLFLAWCFIWCFSINNLWFVSQTNSDDHHRACDKRTQHFDYSVNHCECNNRFRTSSTNGNSEHVRLQARWVEITNLFNPFTRSIIPRIRTVFHNFWVRINLIFLRLQINWRRSGVEDV